MNKEFTNEDIINAAKHCATNADCDNCPFFATLEIEGCIETFTRYIVNNTKTSLHLRQQAQARRWYQKIPITYKLMIAQNRIYVKCSQVLCQPFWHCVKKWSRMRRRLLNSARHTRTSAVPVRG